MLTKHFPIISAGIDYITLTKTDRNTDGCWHQRIDCLLRSEKAKGNFIKAWGMAGYSGFKCGQLQFGKREGSVIVRLSGDLAALDWWDFYQEASTVSRLDLQVTVRCDADPSREVRRAYSQVNRFYKGRHDGPTVTLWRDTTGGATCYVGKRSSDVMFRIYNKASESGLPEFRNCLRYEVELKRAMTRRTIEWLICQDSVKLGIAGQLHTMLSSRGLRPLYRVDVRGCKLQGTPIACDVEKKLVWLRDSVGSTVRALFALGYGPQVLDCLKLHDVVGLKASGGQLVRSSATERGQDESAQNSSGLVYAQPNKSKRPSLRKSGW